MRSVRLGFRGSFRLVARVRDFRRPRSIVQPSMPILSMYNDRVSFNGLGNNLHGFYTADSSDPRRSRSIQGGIAMDPGEQEVAAKSGGMLDVLELSARGKFVAII